MPAQCPTYLVQDRHTAPPLPGPQPNATAASMICSSIHSMLAPISSATAAGTKAGRSEGSNHVCAHVHLVQQGAFQTCRTTLAAAATSKTIIAIASWSCSECHTRQIHGIAPVTSVTSHMLQWPHMGSNTRHCFVTVHPFLQISSACAVISQWCTQSLLPYLVVPAQQAAWHLP